MNMNTYQLAQALALLMFWSSLPVGLLQCGILAYSRWHRRAAAAAAKQSLNLFMEYEESNTVSNYGIIRTSSKCTCIASYDVDGVQATLVFATFEHKRMHYGDTPTFTIISGSSHWQSFGFLTLAEFWMKYLRIFFFLKSFQEV